MGNPTLLRHGFVVLEDAIVACRICGAPRGEPCKQTPKELDGGKRWEKGWSHFGRRVGRLMLTAPGTGRNREEYERRELEALFGKVN